MERYDEDICSLVLAAGLLIGQVATAADRSGQSLAREHRTTLDSYRVAQVRAYLEGNPQAMLAHLADSVRLMPGYQKTVLGKADATTYHQAFLKRFTVSAYDRQAIEAMDLGSRVMEIGRFTMTLAAKGSRPEAHTLAGKYMDLWEKTSTGKLCCIRRRGTTISFQRSPTSCVLRRCRRFTWRCSARAGERRHQPRAGRAQQAAGIAIIQHDGKTWALFYADDAILLANHGAVVSGRKALDEYTVEHAKALPVFEKLDLRTDKIDDFGKYVVEYGTGVVNWRVDEYSGVNLGKNIRVWRRAENGALQIWRAISMYD